jgi:glycosyltransferase involved in cell wall biosynthesis
VEHFTNSEWVPKVSIGLPVYNGDKYINKALDSLLSQSFTDFEIIISDNNSIDNTGTICREYVDRDSRIRYIRQIENIGAVDNFEYVLNEATGRYFKWAAADDFLGNKHTLEKLVKHLEDGFELAMSDVNILDETTRTINERILSSANSESETKSFKDLALKYPSFQIYGLFVTSSLRQNFSILKINSDLRCFGEGVFVHAISQSLKGIFVNEALLVYRRHSDNASSTLLPVDLLRYFLKYTYRLFKFYKGSNISLLKKLQYLKVLGWTHIKYIFGLVLACGKFYARKLLNGFKCD